MHVEKLYFNTYNLDIMFKKMGKLKVFVDKIVSTQK